MALLFHLWLHFWGNAYSLWQIARSLTSALDLANAFPPLIYIRGQKDHLQDQN